MKILQGHIWDGASLACNNNLLRATWALRQESIHIIKLYITEVVDGGWKMENW